jgi:hypothetical protein
MPSWHDLNEAQGTFSLPLDVRNFVELCLPIYTGCGGGTQKRLSAFLIFLLVLVVGDSEWRLSAFLTVVLLCNKNRTTPLMYDNLYPLKWRCSDRRRHFFFASLYKTIVMGPNAQSDILCSLSPWTRQKRRISRGVRHHAPGAKCAIHSIVRLYLIWYLQGLYVISRVRDWRAWGHCLRVWGWLNNDLMSKRD